MLISNACSVIEPSGCTNWIDLSNDIVIDGGSLGATKILLKLHIQTDSSVNLETDSSHEQDCFVRP